MPVIRESENKPVTQVSRKINNKLDLLDKKMNGLYKDIYITRPDNKDNLDTVISNLDKEIDRLQSSEMSVSNMSELIRRVNKDDMPNTKEYLNSVENLFGNQNLVNSLFANHEMYKYIAAENHQYDLICRYIPKLEDALVLKRDNVLCSDNFSKNFINPKALKSSKEEANAFNNNCKRLELEYEISTFFERVYMNVSKYGEEFVYVVPYHIALERLQRRKLQGFNLTSSGAMSQFSLMESYGQPERLVSENFVEDSEYKTFVETVQNTFGKDSESVDSQFKGTEVNVYFNTSGIIPGPVNEMVVLNNKSELEKFRSLAKMHENFIVNEGSTLQYQYDKIKHANDGLSAATHDGLILPSELQDNSRGIDKNINGCVLEAIPRENIVPAYIGSKCFGYFHLQFAEDPNACGYCGNNHTVPGLSNSVTRNINMSENQHEMAVRYIASKLSKSIDNKFINANKDLKEEIYAILKYNEEFDLARSNNITVTFIPAEDIVHCYFEMDEKTHRGISDLKKAVVPAMLYVLLYLTDIIGRITRSNDKRIYYVKQNVETNVARTMMNVVNQIKRGNFGMRQIESMNNIFNIVGKYNDYIIPLGQSGDPPIQFEVMDGQRIETPTEMMEKMEDMAVGTIMPLEMINSSYNQDFAIRYTMSNTRFMKSVYTRQRLAQKFMSKIYTKVYNYEFQENNSMIELILPPPTYLSMTNIRELFDNIAQAADKIVENDMSTEPEEVKAEFKKIYVRAHLGTYLDYESIDRMIQNARVNVEAAKAPAVEDGAESSMDDDDMGF